MPLTIHLGRGANGKSVYLETIRGVVGPDYSVELSSDALTARTRDGGELERRFVSVRQKRLITALELAEGQRLHEQAIKRLVSGEPLRVRELFAESFEITPIGTVMLTSNHALCVAGTDDGVWRRLREVPWPIQIPEDERDPTLRATLLRDEASGILRWMIEGCLAYQREGLAEPNSVAQATARFRASEDVVGAFLADTCQEGRALWVSTADIYAAYCSWCERNGERAESRKLLTSRLAHRGFEPKRIARKRGWAGLDLTPEARRTDETDRPPFPKPPMGNS